MLLQRLRTPITVLIAGILASALAIGLRNTFGLYLSPMSAANGWGREIFSVAIALQNLVWGITAPIFGAMADRWGSGKVVLSGGVLYFAGLYGMSTAVSPMALYLSTGLMIGMGVSAMGFAVVLGAVGRYAPEDKRSLYLSLTVAGGSAGQFLLVPLSQEMIVRVGWSTSLTYAGWLSLLALLLALFLVGRASRDTAAGEATNPISAFGQAGREGRYWLLFWGFFVCGFQITFVSTHLPSFLTDNNIAPRVAALALSLIGLFNIAGVITFGWLGGRYSKRLLLAGIYSGRALSTVFLLLAPLTPTTVIIFAASQGFLWLATVPLTSGLVGQIYGVRYLSTLFGVVFLGHQLGAFLGVWGGGRLFDITGSYNVIWYTYIALGVFSTLIHLPINESARQIQPPKLAVEEAK